MPSKYLGNRWKAAAALAVLWLGASALAAAAEPSVQIVVGTNTYVAFSREAKPGTKVFIDASPTGKTVVHAMQRSLGYREVDYKALVFASLLFQPVEPKTNETAVVYDYSAQTGMTNLAGYLAAKNVPLLVGPDGEPYIADGHHTTAGYLSPLSPVRALVPGMPRILLGHIAGNAFDAAAGPKPVADEWWLARVQENNAYLFGSEGSQLVRAGDPQAATLGPILPSAKPMPTTPSAVAASHLIPMGHDRYRSLAWGMADGIVATALDGTGKKMAGFNKKAPGGGEINFVEFCWADYFRGRIWWDDSRPGTNAAALNAPLSFYAAVANGIALAKSSDYRDQYGRSLPDYTDAGLSGPNTASWASGSLTNTVLGGTNIFHLYWFDDSHVIGAIAPPPKAVNILHLNTTAGMVISNQLQNFSTVVVNEAGFIRTAWRDAKVKNSALRYPVSMGTVALQEGAELNSAVLVARGVFEPRGRVLGRVSLSGGTLQGPGYIAGSLTLAKEALLVLNSPADVLTAGDGARLNGILSFTIAKEAGALKASRLETPKTAFLKGTLAVKGDASQLAEGDSFKLIQAAALQGAFSQYDLPALPGGLGWDTTRIAIDGTLSVKKG